MAKPRGPFARMISKYLAEPLVTALVYGTYGIFRLLPADGASALGGFIARNVGPLLSGTRRARHNLVRAFPEKSAAEIEKIIHGMWNNLGRTFAEYAHLAEISDTRPGGRIELIGAEHIKAMIEDGQPGILVSGHLANWEVPASCTRHLGLELAPVYRAPNNEAVHRLLIKLRGAGTGNVHIPKGAAGARMLMRHLSNGGHVGMLVDQKMNDGIPVPFFGRDAMTAPAAAQLGIRFKLPMSLVRAERLGGTRFRVTFYPPMEYPTSSNRNDAARIIMEQINLKLEEWICERPEEWLWLHRRWPD